jgi:glycosyltransferase involved in cell wall biosynthesis
MRIPFEGIIAAKAMPEEMPLLISVWGNDFTLWAARNPIIAHQTRQALKRADALHSDCHRDLRLALERGLDSKKPTVILPGCGGVQLDIFHPNRSRIRLREKWGIPASRPLVFYPRRFRPYAIDIDKLFDSIRLVVNAQPDAIFLGVGMLGHPIAEKWKNRLRASSIYLLPDVSHIEMADLFSLADVTVSPSKHDGTPNTLLEAMACGCFPIAGDTESLREWITDGINGLLCDANNPDSLARAIIRALQDEQLRNNAREYNLNLIAERAEYNRSMWQAEQFYMEIVRRKQQAMKV